MKKSTIGDPRENEPMTRADEGGEHTCKRHAFFRHNLNGGSQLFWVLFLGVLLVHVHCVHDFFHLHHSGTPFFLGNDDTYCGPGNSSAPFSGWVSDVEPKKIAVFRSAERVCADIKILTSAEKRLWCVDLE